MLFFTIVDSQVLKGISVFGDKLGSKEYPLASVALVEGQFPRALPTPFDDREYLSLDGKKPDCFIDRGYFYQFSGEDHAGRKCSLLPIIIADQPYYSNRSIVMIVLRKGQSLFHEHGTYPLWECCLPSETNVFTYLKLLGIEREGWIDIVNQDNKKISFQSLGYKFNVHEY